MASEQSPAATDQNLAAGEEPINDTTNSINEADSLATAAATATAANEDTKEVLLDETQKYDDEESALNFTNNNYSQQNDYEQEHCIMNEEEMNSQSESFKEIYTLFEGQINVEVCKKLDDVITNGYLKLEQLNETLIESIKFLNESSLQAVFDEFTNQVDQISTDGSDETNTALDRSELLSEKIANWRNSNGYNDAMQQTNSANNFNRQQRPGPDEAKLKEIIERTGYLHEVSSGQRKYGGPPPDWPVKSIDNADGTEENAGEAEKPKSHPVVPPSGCECFVGKLPKDLFEDELIPVFEKFGRIWDLRLMIDPNTGFSKGYCFVTYCDKESAQEAAKTLNNYHIRPGKEIRVNVSVANVKLFIGNIPKIKTKEELKQEFAKVVDGIAEVVIYNPGESVDNDKLKNRGFCFIEFIDHKTASIAKRKLSSPRFNRIFNREIAVDWADPSEEPDEETMSKVKVLFVKNLSNEVTEEEVQQLFEQYGKLERVRKMKDYAFVHFEQREDAVKAMQEQQAKTLGKSHMDISLARPLTDKKKQAQQKRNQNGNGSMNQLNGNRNMNFNNQRQMNNRNFNNNDQFDPQNFGQNRNGNMNRFNNNRNNGRYNNGNNYGSQNNYNSNQNNGFNRNRMNQQGNNNFMNKRKNDFASNNNGPKKGRFNPNMNNNNMNGDSFENQSADQQQQQQPPFMNNSNQFNGNDQASNEWYQDNFNSNQWI